MQLFPSKAWPAGIPVVSESRVANASTLPTNARALPPKAHPAAIPAPVFQSNPLMSTGILEPPPVTGAIAAAFGVDLGAASTIEVARSRWNELQVRQSPLLDNLKPLLALKDGGRAGQELHLIAGPLTSAAAGLRLCAVVSAGGAPCEPSDYEGQHLAAR
jgi:hypothetical protein